MNTPESHESFMRRAIELARQGLGTTRPNPLVGAVIVKDDLVVGEGFHARAGGPHAEIEALHQAGGRARGAAMYVTLEPCNHRGRTPPCTKAILESGIKKVYFASRDPNPNVEGGGAAFLQSKRVQCEHGPLTEEATDLNRGFFHWIVTGRPWIISKFASSLDGRIATRTGESQWITGPEARRRGHELRREVDAILVGSGTVLADDPVLTVRLQNVEPVVIPSAGSPLSGSDDRSLGTERRARSRSMSALANLKAAESLARGRPSVTDFGASNPSEASGQAVEPLGSLGAGSRMFRIVVDGRGRSPLESKIFAPAEGVVTLVATAETSSREWRQALRDRNIEVVILPPGRNHSVDLTSLLDELGRREIRSVLVEGGSTIHGSFFDDGLVNEVWAFLAPMIIGGTAAHCAVDGTGVSALSEALRLESVAVEQLGSDVLIRGMTGLAMTPETTPTGPHPQSDGIVN
ncbi:MAG TPA: bifunctional diaminohydroxyphosphoribosylaminopyrimidine deaminase/5-amino-6-(5-phosphoribosylamino)uracil reductase RibD [Rhodothermia bacterium]|nr:bifunctional diaminohydroxyphosphoribosylaminopyrimidine deaminase/5-amino-6-(5-phosphoribosylamino)uracil reductase RibD [Rhodothermia bacterium]